MVEELRLRCRIRERMNLNVQTPTRGYRRQTSCDRTPNGNSIFLRRRLLLLLTSMRYIPPINMRQQKEQLD